VRLVGRAAGAVALAAVAVAGACSLSTPSSHEPPRTLRFGTEHGTPASTEDLQRIERVVEQRLTNAGITKAKVTANGARTRITVRFDGQADQVDLAQRLIETIGQLRFQPVLSTDGPRLGPASSEGDQVSVAGIRSVEGVWNVTLTLQTEALAALNEKVVGPCFSEQAACPTGDLAVVLDGRVLSLRSIEQRTFSTDALEVPTHLDEEVNRELATILQSGPMPVRLVREA
jgi:preprotein translocase subunit SecD